MFAFILALSLGGCADPFEDAKAADTVEAWQAYIATNPSGSRLLNANQRLEELLIKKARDSKAIADYDALLKAFPKSREKKALQKERGELALAAAEVENTAAGWEKFVKENPWVDGTVVKGAQNRLAVSQYMPSMAFTEVKVEEVNLANDPKGPKDGWGFSVTVTNNGDKTITMLNMVASMLDEQGAVLRVTPYEPLVGPKYSTGQYTPEEIAAPLKPGESRTWMTTTGDVPEGFAKKANVVATKIAFETPVAGGG